VTALGIHEDDDYWPEFGTLTVRDAGEVYDEGGPFSWHESEAQPCGTVVRTGIGWLEGSAGDGPHVVRMESHAVAPPDDTAEWDDVVEIPYRSLSGEVGLGFVTGGFNGDVFPLAGAGAYRLRATRRPVPDTDEWEDLWLLRFWPAEPEPPRWFRRAALAMRPADPGWHTVFSYDVTDLLSSSWAARDESGGTTLEALRRWGERHGRRAGWLEQPVTSRYPNELDPVDVARQLGVPAPSGLAGMLDLFAAAGVLVDDNGSYRRPAVTPNVEDVLDLPAERRDRLIVQRAHDRCCAFASDLVSVAMWGGTTQTLAALAERTLVPEHEVREAIEWAEHQGLLRVEGALDGTFVMTCA
jgi:uncharacterized protein DUF6042